MNDLFYELREPLFIRGMRRPKHAIDYAAWNLVGYICFWWLDEITDQLHISDSERANDFILNDLDELYIEDENGGYKRITIYEMLELLKTITNRDDV